jgi:hypothetical protein
MARSNSANAPSICIIMRPAGPAVSTASVSERKPAPGGLDSLKDVEEVFERAGQPVELPDHDNIGLAELIEQAVQLGAVPPAAGSLLLEHAPAPGGLERVDLGGGVLVVGLGDAGVAEQHGICRTNLLLLRRVWQQVCVWRKALFLLGRPVACADGRLRSSARPRCPHQPDG